MGSRRDRLRQITTSAVGRSAQAALALGSVARHAGPAALGRLARGDRDPDALLAGADPEAARALLATMGRMKGLMMKAGQMASFLDGGVPDAWRPVLAELQRDSPPMEADVVARVVAEELGAPPRERFAEWDDEPFAAASIGQVHRARLPGGLPVAVKVQYPGIRDALESDLAAAGVVGTLKALAFPHVDRASLQDELRARFLEECDYRIEAENVARFRALFAGRAGVRIPAVVGERSAERVITTELAEGARFAEMAATSGPARDRAARIVSDFVWESIFAHRVFNADPHPGNYLFAPDGDVVFLDFGCVKRFPDRMIADWTGMLRAVLERDRAAFRARVIACGFAPEPHRYDFDAHYRIGLYLMRPWLTDEPFAYTPDYCRRAFRMLLVDNPNVRVADMPRDFVFVNRLQWGLNSLLAAMDAKDRWRAPMMDLLYAPGEARPEPFREGELAGL
jgi:predicted unusual protein kinase regulating ubiquinone biosynthesis (AarF/ABC1/UbiB family)